MPPDVLRNLRQGALAGATSLDLSGAGLTEVPAEVFALADTLEVLDLGRNALAGLPHGFGRLRRLRVLFCSGTPMRELPPVLGECSALTQIGFRGCGIETVPGEALPPGLRWLTLTDNRIATLPAAIGERPSLQKLMLAGNRLAMLPDRLAGAGSLELLRLSANRFDTLPAFLGELPALAWLAFGGNPAEGAPGATGPVRAVAWRELALGPVLGEGASGQVHAARWNGCDVAFKRFKGAMTSDGLPAHEMAASLAVGAHPNLLGGLARVEDTPDGAPGLLLRLLPPDARVLAGPPSLATCSRDVYPPGFMLPPGAAGRIARDIAHAGAHLAAHGLLHGDLYAHNIHWDAAGDPAILGDLGAASRRRPGDGLEALDVLAWAILAGELLAHAPVGEANAALAAMQREAAAREPAARPSFGEVADALDAP